MNSHRKSPSTKNTDTELCPYYVKYLKIHWDLEEQSQKDINFKKKIVLIPTGPTESVMLNNQITRKDLPQISLILKLCNDNEVRYNVVLNVLLVRYTILVRLKVRLKRERQAARCKRPAKIPF